MADHREWTRGRLAVLALLVLIFATLLVWAVANYEQYKTLSLIVGALWTAAITVLGYLRVSAPQETSFAELLGSPAVRLVVVVLAVLLVGGAVGMAPRQLSIQAVTVDVEPDGLAGVAIEIVGHGNQMITRMDGPGIVRLPAGTHTFSASRPGFSPWTDSVTIRAFRLQSQRLRITLTPLSGVLALAPAAGQRPSVAIRTTSDSTVVPLQPLPDPRAWRLPPGAYIVTAAANGHVQRSYEITVPHGDTISLAIELDAERVQPPGPTRGTVSFISEPAGAEVIVRGRGRLGTTPLNHELPAGSYDIVIRRLDASTPSVADQRADRAIVVAGRRITVGGPLAALTLARLSIQASPAGDGTYVAREVATGLEHVLGSAAAGISALLFPGSFQLVRDSPAGRTAGPTVLLTAEQPTGMAGF